MNMQEPGGYRRSLGAWLTATVFLAFWVVLIWLFISFLLNPPMD
jgi:hypothetical protein